MVALHVRASLSAGEATCDFNSHTGCQPTCVVVFEGGLSAVLIRCPPPCTGLGAPWPMPAWVWRDVQRDFGLGLSTSREAARQCRTLPNSHVHMYTENRDGWLVARGFCG